MPIYYKNFLCSVEVITKLFIFLEHTGLKQSLKDLIIFLKPNNKIKMYLLQVEMLLVYYEIIEMVSESWKEFQKIKPLILKEELEDNIKIILKALKFNSKSRVPIKISSQQQKDIANEIKRLNAIVQLAALINVWELEKYEDPSLEKYVDAAKNEVFTLFMFNEDKAVETLTVLKTKIKASTVVSKLQREMIVKAIGLKLGHWFKCINGHYYCIDRCGGAMEVSRCPECGEAIGGTNHTLLQDNSHAPEMDGSKYAAYSVEANNMANFLIDF